MTQLAICSASTVGSYPDDPMLNYETHALIEAGRSAFKEIVFVNPQRLAYALPREKKIPKIYYDKGKQFLPEAIIVRGMSRLESSIRFMCNILDDYGCINLDPLSRFAGRKATKLMTTLRRHREGVGSDSFIAFNLEGAYALLPDLIQQEMFPIVAKPIAGKGGKGITLIHSSEAYEQHIEGFFEKNFSEALLFQRFVRFITEFRAMVLDGCCLGLVKKNISEGWVKNVNSGAYFEMVENSEIEAFVCNNVSSIGLLGVDVAIDEMGEYHIIESNRAPNWKEFERVTKIDVAQKTIEVLVQRLANR